LDIVLRVGEVVLLLVHLVDYSVLGRTVLAHLEFAIAVTDHLNIQVVTIHSIPDNAFLFDISIRLVECNADEVCPKVSEEDVVKGRIEAHAFELYVVVYFVCYFEVVHL
jgi:hypothetical protein